MAQQFNKEWSDPLTLQEAVVVGIGLSLTDSIFVMVESISYLKPATTVATAGQTSQAQITESLQLKEAFTFSLGLILSDTMVLNDNAFFYRFGNTRASTNPNKIATGENLAWFQKDAAKLALSLPLVLSDNLNNWLDPQLGSVDDSLITLQIPLLLSDQMVMVDVQPTVVGAWQIALFCPHMGQNWLDLQVDFQVTPTQLSKSDIMSMSDAFATNLAGVASEALSDSLTMADNLDSVALGLLLPLTDTMTMTDVAPSITGQLQLMLTCPHLGVNWNDTNFTAQLGSSGSEIDENLSDTLTMSDALGLGYGEGMVEQLSLSDATGLGYGFAITDQMTMTDSDVVVLGMTEVIADTLVLSDALEVGYGNATVDSLTFVDAAGVGYGFQIADQLVLSEAVTLVFSFQEIFAETLTLADAESLGYGFSITDQLTMADVLGLGYGDALTDQLVLSDSFSEQLSGGPLTENLSDSLSMADQLGLGYGLQFTDAMSMADQQPIIIGQLQLQLVCAHLGLNWQDEFDYAGGIQEVFTDTLSMADSELLGFGLLITDQLSMSDLLGQIGIGMLPAEQMTFVDQLGIGYGDIIVDQLVMAELVSVTLTGPIVGEPLTDQLTMSDSLLLGYGLKIAEQMVMQDVQPTIIGQLQLQLICAHLGLNWQDSATVVKGLNEVFTDTLTMSDSAKNSFPPLGAFFEQMVLTDSIEIGYGLLPVDALSLSDPSVVLALSGGSISLLLSDQLQLTEFVNILFTEPVFADQMTLSDAFSFLLQNASQITETLAETLSMSDKLRIGYGELITGQQLVFVDAFQFNLSSAFIPELPTDTLVMSDKMILGYGLQTQEQMVTDLQQASDTFSRPNENPLNAAAWSLDPDGDPGLQIVSNTCRATGIANGGIEIYTGITWQADQWAQITLAHSTSGSELDILLRALDDSSEYYDFGFADNGNGTLDIFIIVVAPALPEPVLLVQNSNLPFSIGDVFRARVVGTELSFYQNGNRILVGYDSNITAANNVWLFLGPAVTTADLQVTNFIGGLAQELTDQINIGYGLLPVELLVSELQLAQDTFNRPNESPLNPANWTQTSLETQLQIVSNNCLPSVIGSGGSGEFYTGITWPSDQYVAVTLGSSNVGGEFDVLLRAGQDLGSGNLFGYDYGFIDNGNGTADVYIATLLDNGSEVILWEQEAQPFNDGDVFTGLVTGNVLAFYQNGKMLGWAHDTNYTGGQVFLQLIGPNSTADIQIADFIGGQPQSAMLDQVILQPGFLVADSLTLTDKLTVGYGDVLSDQMVMADSFIITTPNLQDALFDSLTMVDQLVLGYGDIIVEQMTLTDSVAFLYPLALAEADTLTMSDKMLLGYGDVIAEQLTLVDTATLGYGDAVNDQLTMFDLMTFQLLGGAIGVTFGDFLTFTDVDFVALGLGLLPSDALALSDATVLGYGDLLSDVMTLTDALTFSFVQFATATDTLTLADKMLLGYGLLPADSLVMAENLVIGYGEQITDQMTMVDAPVFGISLIITDQMVMVERVGAGYGNMLADQTVGMTDQMQLVDGLVLLLTDATMQQMDAVNMLFTYALQVNEVMTLREQLVTTWGIITGDSITMADQLSPSLQNLIALALEDDASQTWADQLVQLLVFAPSEIILKTISVFPELLGNISTQPEATIQTVTVESEVEEV